MTTDAAATSSARVDVVGWPQLVAGLLGFPNPYLGIAGFAVVAVSGAMRLAGGRPALWYRVAGLAGSSWRRCSCCG